MSCYYLWAWTNNQINLEQGKTTLVHIDWKYSQTVWIQYNLSTVGTEGLYATNNSYFIKFNIHMPHLPWIKVNFTNCYNSRDKGLNWAKMKPSFFSFAYSWYWLSPIALWQLCFLSTELFVQKSFFTFCARVHSLSNVTRPLFKKAVFFIL